jgi:hypothetical protein
MELVKLIRKLRRKLKEYKELYSRNEAAVREHIVNPFLRALKWDPENPKQVIPEYPTEKKKKLDYVLVRNKTPLAVIEVKTLGKVKEGLKQVLTDAQAIARYIIVTDGDTWELHDISRPMKETLIREWSLLKGTPKKVAEMAQIIANTKNFGNPEAPTFQTSVKTPVKCPYCNKRELKLLKAWKFKFYDVKRLKCLSCRRIFNYYYGVSPKAKKVVTFVIRSKRRGR